MSISEDDQRVTPPESPLTEEGLPATAVEQQAADAAVLQESRKHTRRDFAVALAGAAAGYGIYQWIGHSRPENMQPMPLRRAFEANAKLSQAISHDQAMAPTYPVGHAEDLRINGIIGLKEALDTDSWRLQFVGVADEKSRRQYVPDVTAWQYKYAGLNTHEDKGHDTKTAPRAEPPADRMVDNITPELVPATKSIREQRPGRLPRGHEEAGESQSTLRSGTPGLLLTMADVLSFSKCELVTEFKCIEGWSQIAHWKGIRFADLIHAYPPATKADGSLPRYVYMETPNGDYYVGYDLKVCMHPQTLLATEMGGAPLTQFHGAPLRLHTPAKYGYKQIKRIGLIAYTDEKPDDYWTRLGYDWYAGI